MGAKQSSPTANPAANGRTRAYSGSDLPSSTSSSNGRTTGGGVRYQHAYGASGSSGAAASAGQQLGVRARTAEGSGTRPQTGFSIPNNGAAYSSPESGGSSPEEASAAAGAAEGPRLMIGSLPAHLSPHLFGGFKCPVCSVFVSSDEMDLHLVLCLTKPRVTYNDLVCVGSSETTRSKRDPQRGAEDVLTKDAGECAICLEELQQGDTIARLPCLCIYHKNCIDKWFDVNRSCPGHPSD